jgi:hypothetical protein
MSKAGSVAVLHAWGVGPDGVVIDGTWRDPSQATYFGVIFDWPVIAESLRAFDSFGVLPNWAWDNGPPSIV